MERVKAMQRGNAAAEPYRPELLADEEPRYLRRQKPLEIRRKKFGGRSWTFYRRVLVWTVVGATGITCAIGASRFLLYSPQVLLLKSDQIELLGNHIVSREAVLQPFARDRNRSVLRIPLDARRAQLEELPWVESASVQRILAQSHSCGTNGTHTHRVFAQWQRARADRCPWRDSGPPRRRRPAFSHRRGPSREHAARRARETHADLSRISERCRRSAP